MCDYTHPYAGGERGEDGVEQHVREQRGEVAERLVCVLGDDDGVAPSSQGGPAVAFGWRQGHIRLPLQHLETNGTALHKLCEQCEKNIMYMFGEDFPNIKFPNVKYF